jgi:hypothetical protein
MWVIAYGPEEAVELVEALEDHQYSDEKPYVERQIGQTAGRKIRYGIDGDPETCSMWMAYLLIRDHASTVIACSEWS